MMILESNSPPYSYGCVMLSFPEKDTELLHCAQSHIFDEELDSSGREWDSHVTVRYGTESENFQELYDDARAYFEQVPLKVIGIDMFATPDSDCIHFRVEVNSKLMAMRHLVERVFKCVEPTHPEYIPHITIAYVKKGAGKEVMHRISEAYDFPFIIAGSTMFYAPKNGKRHIIPLKSPSEIATESLVNLTEKYKHPSLMMAKIVVPKKTLSDHAIKKHTKRLEKLDGKYEKHADGRHIFRVPQQFARQIYHEIYNTRGIIPDKKEPVLSYY